MDNEVIMSSRSQEFWDNIMAINEEKRKEQMLIIKRNLCFMLIPLTLVGVFNAKDYVLEIIEIVSIY